MLLRKVILFAGLLGCLGLLLITGAGALQDPAAGAERTVIENAPILARGDEMTISGIAAGQPDAVYIWIFGTNYRLLSNRVGVEPDGTYRYVIGRAETREFAPGRYFAVVQHPMTDGEQDVSVVSGTTISVPGGTPVDLARLQAPEAAAALIEALNSPNSDDTYTLISFWVEDPWIRFGSVATA
ncbi:hypothetical protein FGU65_06900 [Methanoculleus sp. FWC-SCC1]|uniref:DUF3821 domain-containing protein n=1 Tax=Methanoculleus frigidifontis TaxID=2584085 RepID=A0ABT8M9L4_9EURY|nr:hypothetical protein [Methanoculleus sp. FWC-SCC1]MDN7024617.1 hypothetical protein [Methanoculleus sp. FWC-SCC1]